MRERNANVDRVVTQNMSGSKAVLSRITAVHNPSDTFLSENISGAQRPTLSPRRGRVSFGNHDLEDEADEETQLLLCYLGAQVVGNVAHHVAQSRRLP